MAKAPEITVTVRDLPEVKAALERAAKIAVAGDALAEAVGALLLPSIVAIWPTRVAETRAALAAWKEATDD